MKLAFIPARCGSKSIPLKNIKRINGMPLIFWSIKALVDSECFDRIVVATDCQDIIDVVEGFSFAQVECYERHPNNASDDASTESVILEYLEYQADVLSDDDLFVLVQATSPLTQAEHFRIALQQLAESGADSLLTCVRTKRFFWKENGTPLNYDFMSRPRRQDFDGILMENGAFYINSVSNIRRDKNRLSGHIAIFEMPENTAVELDEEDDWLVVEKLLEKHTAGSKDVRSCIKLFLSDVDGTLTDAGMYYDQNGNELKKFNTHDGKAFELLRLAGFRTGILTSEDTEIVRRRASKLKVDYLYQGIEHAGKLDKVLEICALENITIRNVAYIGDDINCKELLERVGVAACPANALSKIKDIPGIIQLDKDGGHGAVREFAEIIMSSIKDQA